MFNSHYRNVGGTSPTLQYKHNITYDSKLDIHQQIQCLEEEWNNIELHQENNMMQIEKILQKIDCQVNKAKQKTSFKVDQQIENLVKHLTITSNIEREVILQTDKKLKDYVSSKQRIIDEILEGQIKEEDIFQKEISDIIDKRLDQIRKKVVKQTQPVERSKFVKKKQPQNSLKLKLAQKIKTIEAILSDNKQEVKKMKRQSQKLIRQYLRVKDEIESAKADREDKQEHILAKIEELCLGDRTKEETISKIY